MNTYGKCMSARGLLILFLLAATVLVPEQAVAQKKRRGASSPKVPVSSWRFPALTKDSLQNGLKIIHVRTSDLPLIEINMMFDAGAVSEPDSLPGLALLSGKLLFSGTSMRTRAGIASDISRLGAAISSSTTYDYSQIYLRTLSRNFRQSLDILADICMNSRFTEFEFQAERKRMLSGLSATRRNPAEEATRILLARLFGEGHALARPQAGTAADFERISLNDAQRFFDTRYRPEKATLVIAGNIEYRPLRVLLEDRFGAWSRSEKPASGKQASRRTGAGRVVLVDDSTSRFAQIRVGFRIPNRAHGDFPTLLVMNQIFGGDAQSRLHRSLWGEHYVMPSFFSSLGVFKEGGWLIAGGSAPASRVDSTLIWIEESITSMADRAVTPEELRYARRILAEDYPLLYATNRRMLEQLIDMVLFDLKQEDLEAFPSVIDKVGAEDVKRTAARLISSDKATIVVWGNAKMFSNALRKKYGDRLEIISPF